MPQETILILGASFAGISAAHYTLRHVLPALPKTPDTTYAVTLVNPSSDFYWRVAGPRATVSKELMPPSKYLYPIAPAFSSYPKESFSFIQGTATALDTASRSVAVTLADGSSTSITYHALIIATGTNTPAPQLSQHSTTAPLTAALEEFQAALPKAKSVIIGGGGPVGVETAGEIGEFLNGTPGFFGSKPAHPKAKVTLIAGDKKLLPILRPAIAKTAEKYLARVGVEVIYNVKVSSTSRTSDGDGEQTTVTLADGKTLTADLYVDATGVRPNTGYLPKELLTDRGYVACNTSTLRVEAAGPRVYVVGDAGSYTRGGIMDIYDSLPVVMTNLKKDLLGKDGPDRTYTPNNVEQQVVPVGRGKGVGAFAGWRVPSWFVWMVKGRDYLTSMAPDHMSGKKWVKEAKWTAIQEKAGVQGGSK